MIAITFRIKIHRTDLFAVCWEKKEKRKTSISSIEIFSLNSKEQYDLELFAHHQSHSCHEIINKGKGDHNSASL
jgi:hypothetical protein